MSESLRKISAVMIMAFLSVPATAQEQSDRAANGDTAAIDVPTLQYLQQTPADEQPDVLLIVPELSIDEIEVDELNADLSLEAQVSELVELKAGADITIGDATLKIKGLATEATLVIRLDNVRDIVERALTAIESNPELLRNLSQTMKDAAEKADQQGPNEPGNSDNSDSSTLSPTND